MNAQRNQGVPFDLMVKRGKSQPVLWWMLIFSKKEMGTQEACAYELTQYAIQNELVANRSAVPGNTLNDWIKSNKAPYWATLAAMELCLKESWSPSDDSQWAVFAHLWVRRNGPFRNPETAFGSLPKHLDQKQGAFWLKKAVDSDNTFRKKKNQERRARLSPDYKASVAIKAIQGSPEEVAKAEGLDEGQLVYWVSVIESNTHLLHDACFNIAVNGWTEAAPLIEKVNGLIHLFSNDTGEYAKQKELSSDELAEVVLNALRGEKEGYLSDKFDVTHKQINTLVEQTVEKAPVLFDQNFAQFKEGWEYLKGLNDKLDQLGKLIREGQG